LWIEGIPLAQPLDKLLPLIDVLAIVGIVKAVDQAFKWFDELLNEAARETVARWLTNTPDDSKTNSWASVFALLIDKVFGERPLSWRFLFRSCAASSIAVATVTLFFYRFAMVNTDQSSLRIVLLFAFICATVASFVPDYFSLLLSRTIVRLMAQSPTPRRVALLLVTDTVLTAVIAETGIYCLVLAVLASIGLLGRNPTLVGSFLRSIPPYKFALIAAKRGFYGNLLSIFFYSAFFTSMWVWLYVLSAAVIKSIQKLRFVWVRVLPYLDIEKRPIIAMGKIVGLLLGSLWAIVGAAKWLIHHLL
jgi:hypothetical protein